MSTFAVKYLRVMIKALKTVGRYIMLMGRVFARPERMRMFFRQYINEMEQLGVNSIGIVLLISFSSEPSLPYKSS